MMTYLRKKMKVILILVIIFFVAFIFLQWGLNITSGNTLKQDGRYIAYVGGEKVTRDMYVSKINTIRQDYMKNSGRTSIDEKEEEYIQEEAFNTIADNIIFSKIEKKYGYFATSDEISDIIMNVPPQEVRQSENFYIEGQFSIDLYKQFITDPRNREFYNYYYRQIAEQLPKLKMQTDIISGVKINQDEILRELRMNESKFSIEYAVIPNNYSKEITVKDEEARSYYDNNSVKFYQMPKAEIKMIIIKKEASAQDVLMAKENIDGLRDDIVKGNIEFGKAASLYSDDFKSAAENGSLGYIKRGVTVKEFDEMAFSLKKGELSMPVKTVFGWHILKCEDVKRDSVKISHILIKVSPSYETVQTQYDKVNHLLERVKEIGLDEAAQQEGYDIIITQPFDYITAYIFELNNYARKISAFVTNSKIGSISNVINEADYFAICQIVSKKEKGIPAFEDIKNLVINRIIREKKKVLSSIQLSNIVKTMNNEKISLKKYADNNNVKYVKTDMISLNTKLEYIPESSKLIGGILASEDSGIYYVSDYDNGYIFRVIDRKEVVLEESRELIDKYHQMLINERQQAILRNWAATITDIYKIKDLRY